LFCRGPCAIIGTCVVRALIVPRGNRVYTLTIEREFAAAHSLRGYDGKCGRLHGHNYRVEVSVTGQPDAEGMVLDFAIFKRVCDEVLSALDHRLLNEIPPFDEQNPTCELICKHICDQAIDRLDSWPVSVRRVRLWETPTSSVVYKPDPEDNHRSG
jgi:6-pyruvoyltetrahydropterin/6-carboxytetrahydropterin synthase